MSPRGARPAFGSALLKKKSVFYKQILVPPPPPTFRPLTSISALATALLINLVRFGIAG